MKRSIIAALALAALTSNALALTLQQAQNELAGMYCAGSTCTSSATGTRTEAVPGAPIVSGGYSEAKSAKQPDPYNDICPLMTFGSIELIGDVPTCIPGSMLGSASTSPQIVDYQPDGSKTIGTVTTTTKELVYNGPNTSRDTAWSVNTTVTTADAP